MSLAFPDKHGGHRGCVGGLCGLLPQQPFTRVLIWSCFNKNTGEVETFATRLTKIWNVEKIFGNLRSDSCQYLPLPKFVKKISSSNLKTIHLSNARSFPSISRNLFSEVSVIIVVAEINIRLVSLPSKLLLFIVL